MVNKRIEKKDKDQSLNRRLKSSYLKMRAASTDWCGPRERKSLVELQNTPLAYRRRHPSSNQFSQWTDNKVEFFYQFNRVWPRRSPIKPFLRQKNPRTKKPYRKWFPFESFPNGSKSKCGGHCFRTVERPCRPQKEKKKFGVCKIYMKYGEHSRYFFQIHRRVKDYERLF